MTKRLTESQRCRATTAGGKRCTLKRQRYGDGTLCGIHYHRERREQLARKAGQ